MQSCEGKQEHVWYIMCHIIHLNAVVSVIDIGDSNEIWRYHKTELSPSHSGSKYSLEGKQENAWYVLCHIRLVIAVISVNDVGGSNVIWRLHRSELRSSHSDSKQSRGKARECLMCFVPHSSRECSHLSNCCAWLLVNANHFQRNF